MTSNTPIVLCHPACSGGSWIYTVLCTHFDLIGLSEKSHAFNYPKDVFLPTDPEYSLKLAQIISSEVFGDIFIDRIRNCMRICNSYDKTLLIREHTHSYFFQNDEIAISHPSWIALRLHEKYQIPARCILTFRDPIDSWLGLQRSFPELAGGTFEQYCRNYLVFLQNAKASEIAGTALIVKYEEFVENPEKALERVANYLSMTLTEGRSQASFEVVSSGNSGRQSDVIKIRKRRQFDYRLYNQAKKSESYKQIIEILMYLDIQHSSTSWQKVMSPLYQAQRVLATIALRLTRRLHRWVRKNAYYATPPTRKL